MIRRWGRWIDVENGGFLLSKLSFVFSFSARIHVKKHPSIVVWVQSSLFSSIKLHIQSAALKLVWTSWCVSSCVLPPRSRYFVSVSLSLKQSGFSACWCVLCLMLFLLVRYQGSWNRSFVEEYQRARGQAPPKRSYSYRCNYVMLRNLKTKRGLETTTLW